MQVGSVTLSPANIKYRQFYVSSIRELFFPDGRHLDTVFDIDIGDSRSVQTTIMPEYLYFRNKSWMPAFFDSHGLEAGDTLVITKTGPTSFQLRVKKRAKAH